MSVCLPAFFFESADARDLGLMTLFSFLYLFLIQNRYDSVFLIFISSPISKLKASSSGKTFDILSLLFLIVVVFAVVVVLVIVPVVVVVVRFVVVVVIMIIAVVIS